MKYVSGLARRKPLLWNSRIKIIRLPGQKPRIYDNYQ